METIADDADKSDKHAITATMGGLMDRNTGLGALRSSSRMFYFAERSFVSLSPHAHKFFGQAAKARVNASGGSDRHLRTDKSSEARLSSNEDPN